MNKLELTDEQKHDLVRTLGDAMDGYRFDIDRMQGMGLLTAARMLAEQELVRRINVASELLGIVGR